METLRRYALLALVIFLLSGCIKPEVADGGGEVVEVLDVEPVIDYHALGGYTGEAKENLFVVAGDVSAAKEKLIGLVSGEAMQETVFDAGEPLNLVVFMGVFPTGGYGIKIERVEKIADTFIVHAKFASAGRGMMVTQAFTQPTAIVPIGKLSAGSYRSKLIVTRVSVDEGRENILQEGAEIASFEFKVN